jgi:hypothetical protein
VSLMAVVWVLMGVTGVIHAMTNSGIDGFMGWVTLGSASLLFYSNSISWFSQGSERRRKEQASFAGQIMLAIVVAVRFTIEFGV